MLTCRGHQMNRSLTRQLVPVIAAAAIILTAGTGHAAVLFDFNSVGATPTLGGTWNVIAAPSDVTSGIKNHDGTDSSVTLDFGGSWQDSTTNQNISGWNSGNDLDWVDADAVRDYFWDGGDVSLTFGGLTVGQAYNVEIVAARETTGSRVGTYTLNGVATTTDVSSTDYDANATGWSSDPPILRWLNVTPDANGDFLLQLTPDSGDTVWLNAARIEVVPEPAGLALLGVGSLLMLGRGRRQA